MFHEFYLDLYNRTFLLVVDKTTEELHEYMKKYQDGHFEPLDVTGCLGNVNKFVGKDISVIVIYIKSKDFSLFNLGTIVHECVHAASEVFKHCVIDHDLSNEEPYSYLVDWIFRQILEAMGYVKT